MLGASSRAAIHLMSATKAHARLEGREAATIDDVRAMAHVRADAPSDRCEDDDLTPEDALDEALESPIISRRRSRLSASDRGRGRAGGGGASVAKRTRGRGLGEPGGSPR